MDLLEVLAHQEHLDHQVVPEHLEWVLLEHLELVVLQVVQEQAVHLEHLVPVDYLVLVEHPAPVVHLVLAEHLDPVVHLVLSGTSGSSGSSGTSGSSGSSGTSGSSGSSGTSGSSGSLPIFNASDYAVLFSGNTFTGDTQVFVSTGNTPTLIIVSTVGNTVIGRRQIIITDTQYSGRTFIGGDGNIVGTGVNPILNLYSLTEDEIVLVADAVANGGLWIGPAIQQYDLSGNTIDIIGFQSFTGYTDGTVTFLTPIVLSGITSTTGQIRYLVVDNTGKVYYQTLTGGTGSSGTGAPVEHQEHLVFLETNIKQHHLHV